MLNPIFVKCARSRLRVRHILTWGLIVVVTTSFICMMAYLGATQRLDASPDAGAKAMILPIIVIQAVIMMLLGTGSIATAVAQERESGLIDYQRMTPMRPTAKILGYLFGLPSREYFLVFLLMPLVIVASVIANLSILTLAHFYVVFFSAVWLYHLAAMAVGMISPKPRRAGIFAQGAVVLLYFVLPQISYLGITFFEFLTIRPTFFGLVAAELREVSPAAEEFAMQNFAQLDAFRDVPFFGIRLAPTVYALCVQSFLIAFLFLSVHRKWRDERAHALSKLSAVLFQIGFLIFVTGSLWPIVTLRTAYRGVAERFFSEDSGSPAQLFTIILLVFICLALFIAVYLIHTISPSAHTAAAGARRARKLGAKRIPLNSDAAGATMPSAIIALATSITVGLLIWLASETGFFEHAPTILSASAPLILIPAVVLTFHAVNERFGGRGSIIIFFICWAIPAFSALVIAAAEGEPILVQSVALPFPPVAIGYALFNMFAATTEHADMREAMIDVFGGERTLRTLVWTGVGGYALIAVAAQTSLRLWRRRLLRRAIEQMPDQPAPAHEAVAA